MKAPSEFIDYVGKYKGEKALVMGNGPSVRDFPLEDLYGWSGPTFGVNRCLYWFTPDYYFNIYALQNYACQPKQGHKIRFDWTDRMGRADEYGTGRLSLSTIGLTAITAAFQMGCTEIHLIGIDFHTDKNGSAYFYNRLGNGRYFKPNKLPQHIKNFSYALDLIEYEGAKVIQHNRESLVQP